MSNLKRKDVGLNGDVYEIDLTDNSVTRTAVSIETEILEKDMIEAQKAKEEDLVMVEDVPASKQQEVSKPEKHKARHVIVPILTFLIGAGAAVGTYYLVQYIQQKQQKQPETNICEIDSVSVFWTTSAEIVKK